MEVAMASPVIAAEEDAGNHSVGTLVQESMHRGVFQTSNTKLGAETETCGNVARPWGFEKGRLRSRVCHGGRERLAARLFVFSIGEDSAKAVFELSANVSATSRGRSP